MIEGTYDFKAYDLYLLTRYLIQDFDDDKAGVQADSNVFQLDLIKQFVSVPNLYARFRFVAAKTKNDTIAIDGTLKPDLSYRDVRFELNYLF